MNRKEKRAELANEFEQKYNGWISEGIKGEELSRKIIETMEIMLYRYQQAVFGGQTTLDAEGRRKRAQKAGKAGAEAQRKAGRYNFHTNEKG